MASPDLDSAHVTGRSAPLWLKAVAAVAAGALLLAGMLFYQSQERELRTAAEGELETIANLKSAEIATWRMDRIRDGDRMSHSPSIGLFVARWLDAPSAKHTEELKRLLDSLRFGDRYRDVMLVDSSGQVLIRAADTDEPLHPLSLEGLDTALDERRTVLTDLHAAPNDQHGVHMDVITPIYGEAGAGGEPVAAMILHVNAADFLYPLITSWPTSSETAETLLITRDGDEVILLSPPKHIDAEPLGFRIPLENADVSVVRAALGEEGIMQGIDYRGEPVLSYLTRVPDSPWLMVAEVSMDEAFAAWRTRSLLIVALVLALAAGVFGTTGLGWLHVRSAGLAELLATERAQKAAEKRLGVTLCSIGDAVISTDSESRVEFMNPVAEYLTGWSAAEATGKVLQEVFQTVHEVTRERMESPISRVLRDGEVVGVSNHTLLLSRDGMEWPIAKNAAPIHDESDEITGAVLVFRDQTEERAGRRALSESEERFRVLIEQTDQGISAGRPDGTILVYNRAMQAISGYTREEVEEHGWFALAFPTEERRAEACLIAEQALQGNMSYVEMAIVRKDGEERWLSVSTTPVLVGGVEYNLSIFTDVTDRKVVEQELLEYKGHLEELVDVRTRELAVINEELEEATRAKSAFLASMSHELRTPLNSVIGFSGLLGQGLAGPLAPEQHTQIGMIKKSGEHLLSLINDVLDLSKVEAGKVDVRIQTFNPVVIVQEVAESLRPLASEKGLTLDVSCVVDEGLDLVSDVGKIKQILLNLAGNAVKFTVEGSVMIRLECTGGGYRFSITDTGPGIPRDELERIFEPFAQIENVGSEAKPKGTGLGLALSREYAQMLGGEISVTSEVGMGSVFTLLVPESISIEPNGLAS